MDSHRRSIAKALSYRVLGLVITTTVALVVTGRAQFAAAIGIVDTLVKVLFYYLHERAWNRARFGRARPPEYEI